MPAAVLFAVIVIVAASVFDSSQVGSSQSLQTNSDAKLVPTTPQHFPQPGSASSVELGSSLKTQAPPTEQQLVHDEATRRWQGIRNQVDGLAGSSTISIWIDQAEDVRSELHSLFRLAQSHDGSDDLPHIKRARHLDRMLDNRLAVARRLRSRGCQQMPLTQSQIKGLATYAPDSAVAIIIDRCGVTASVKNGPWTSNLGPLATEALESRLDEPWHNVRLEAN